MNRWRAGAAVGWVAAALLLSAAPAAAFEKPAVTISGPRDGQVLVAPTISGTAEMTNGLNSIVGLTIEVRPTGRGDSKSCNGPGCGATLGRRAASFSYSPPLAYNGPYEATVTAVGKDILNLLGADNESGSATRRFKVEAKPASPRNVKAQVNPDRTVTVSWSRNDEPDLIGYQVQRRSGGSAFTAVDSVTQPSAGSTVSLTDRAPAATGGSFEYVVIAARPNGDGSPQNPVSSGSSPTAPVAVAGPDGRPPAAGAPTGGGGGGSSRGGAVSASLQVSSFLAKAGGGGVPAVALPSVDVPDEGFSSTLPLELPEGELAAESLEEDGELAVDDEPGSDERRAVLIPIAAGLLLCVAAAHLRWLNRRMADASVESELPAWSEGDVEDAGAAVSLATATGPVATSVEDEQAPAGGKEPRRRRRRRSEPEPTDVDDAAAAAPDDELLRPPAPEDARSLGRPPTPVDEGEDEPAEVLVAPPARRGWGRRGRGARQDEAADTGAEAAVAPVEPAAVAAEPEATPAD
ncbi:MAG TPA: fibronectin type III domain-containing protein, partial [Acidimicrobiales bacterium]|nr:fibronectin type III domain-containing protein [Acidimicrobiales bacterium]